MRKTLLLASALVCASTMMGVTVAERSKAVVKPAAAVGMTEMPLAYETFETMATPGTHAKKVAAKASPDDGTPKAFYKRPAGAFYGLISTLENNNYKYSSQYSPYVVGWPFKTATYEQNTLNIGENATYDWVYTVYDRETKQKVDKEAQGEKLVVNYSIKEVDSVPTLTATGSEGSAVYTINGWSVTGSGSNKAINKKYRSNYLAAVDYQTAFSNTADRTLWCTPKFRAASTNRDASNLSGGTYVSGAKDGDGGTTGRWFGRNHSGVDALAMAFEKPEHPYVLRKVGVAFQNLAFASTDPCDLKVKVYKLDAIPEYEASTSVYVEPGELLCEGTFTMNPEEFTSNSITNGILPFELLAPDDGSGLDIYIEPEIDFPILVVFTGYNNSTIADFTLTQGTDVYNEGFGEPCYLGRTQEDGSILYQGLNYFFSSGQRMGGISIYAEVAHPYMVWNYLTETGEYEFPVEGGEHSVEVYTYSSAEEWDISMADGSELPAWLTVEAQDKMEDGEWTGVTTMVANAEALPEGTAYREAVVRLHINGNSLEYKFTQGEYSPVVPVKGDVDNNGEVDVTDVNILLNIILGLDDAANYNGRADVTGEGDVDVADVNAVINLILGN